MNILAVDDERLILEKFIKELGEVFPGECIVGQKSGGDALKYISTLLQNSQVLHYAFLDIRLRDMTGIELGKRIKELCPETKIIFCTAYPEYACDSYQMNAIGYLLKPVMASDVLKTLKAMDRDWKQIEQGFEKEIFVQTFGIFEVYVNEVSIPFEREKARELFAYLVDRRGENVTVSELAEVLFEDKSCDRKTMNQVYAILSSLKKSLSVAGILNIYQKKWKYLSVDMSKLKCDFIELENGNAAAMNAYKGNYLACYSWGEFTNGKLETRLYNI